MENGVLVYNVENSTALTHSWDLDFGSFEHGSWAGGEGGNCNSRPGGFPRELEGWPDNTELFLLDVVLELGASWLRLFPGHSPNASYLSVI